MTTVDKDVEELKRSCTSGYVKLWKTSGISSKS